MKKCVCLLVLLGCSLLTYAQKNGAKLFGKQYTAIITDSLPKVSGFLVKSTDVVIKDRISYYQYFADYDTTKLPQIDFKQYNLVGWANCHWCIGCPKDHQQCHRNACHYQVIWALIERK